jgi:hypothetical protein
MTLKGKTGISLRHATAVVDNLYGCTSGIYHQDVDGMRSSVDSILHQFLDDGCRPLDDFSSSYLVGYAIR